LGAHVPEPVVSRDDRTHPEHEALLADAVGPALLVVLEALAPAARVAFVLQDIFNMPFDEIAPIVGRAPAAARQLARRARRRVQGDSFLPTISHGHSQLSRTYLIELLNNIRWGIHEYLLPEYHQSYTPEGGNPPMYSYKYPEGVIGKFAQDRYWL
jgi:hypothetical protein